MFERFVLFSAPTKSACRSQRETTTPSLVLHVFDGVACNAAGKYNTVAEHVRFCRNSIENCTYARYRIWRHADTSEKFTKHIRISFWKIDWIFFLAHINGGIFRSVFFQPARYIFFFKLYVHVVRAASPSSIIFPFLQIIHNNEYYYENCGFFTINQ